MKKLISVILAAATVFTMSSAVLADTKDDEKKIEKPTFAFDTDSSFSYLHKFGNASDTNLKVELTDKNAYDGRSLKLSEGFSSSVSNRYGGIYIDSSDFGLESFAGYTMKMKMRITKPAAKATDYITVFGDGEQWTAVDIPTDKNDQWIDATISIPSGVADTKLGVSIPITEPFAEDVLVIDNLVISDNYGKQLANVGDVDTSLSKKPNTLLSILSVLGFIILFAGIVAGGVFTFLKLKRRFR